jgi:hypothetical protein
MAAAQKRLEVSARNVANLSARRSDDEAATAFAALRMDQVEISGGGTAAVSRAARGTEVDLAGEAVQLMVALQLRRQCQGGQDRRRDAEGAARRDGVRLARSRHEQGRSHADA